MTETNAIRIATFGGSEVLKLAKVEIEDPAPGQVLIEHSAIGLNMVDTYYRTGLYALELPSGLGSEAAGVVVATGSDVEFAPGDRVAYTSPPPLDAYSERRVIEARWLVKLPDNISNETAAAMMLKGLTSWYLLHRSYAVAPGDTILLYAAAGGVGQICAQWAKHVGARVIGVVGSESKEQLARKYGCDEVILASDDIASRVREFTDGVGVPVVYDSIGRDTFIQSLDCLRPHGVMVSFGNASGPVDPFSPLELARRGSLYVTRPTLWDFVRDRTDLVAASQALFAAVGSGNVNINVQQQYRLRDVAQAHRDLEGRRTTGSTVLLP